MISNLNAKFTFIVIY